MAVTAATDRLQQARDAAAEHLGVEARPLLEAAHAEATWLVAHDADLAVTSFCAGALVGLLVEGALSFTALPTMTERLCRDTGADPVAVGLRALEDPRLALLPLEVGLDASLGLLSSLAPIEAPAIWVVAEDGSTRLLRWLGEVPAEDGSALVARLVAGTENMAYDDGWLAVVVRRFQQPSAALVFRIDPGAVDRGRALAAVTARSLGRSFERAALFAAGVKRTVALARSGERRAIRAGYDLHDGPLQELLILRYELDRLRKSVATDTPNPDLSGRLDDLDDLVASLDVNLREVANSLGGSNELRRPFSLVLGDLVHTFGRRTGIEPRVTVGGEVDGLSDSQRITLLRVVQECLTNIKEHSRATSVSVTISAGTTQVDAMVEDDGVGFDVEEALRRSALHGRMGLLGIVERVRLLGGFVDIDSRPGAGCCVSLSVARWTQEMAAMATLDAAA